MSVKDYRPLTNSILSSILIIAAALWFRLFVAAGVLLAAIWLLYSFRHKGRAFRNTIRLHMPQAGTFINGLLFLGVGLLLGVLIYRFVFELIQVPSASMETAIPTGKYIVVNKLVPGPRRYPGNPERYFRMRGVGALKKGDIVLFNFPEGDTILENRPAESYYYLRRHYNEFDRLREIRQWGRLIALKVQERPRFVKRLTALPGDTLEINNNNLIVNGALDQPVPTIIKKYRWHGTREAFSEVSKHLNLVNQYTTRDHIEAEMTIRDYASLDSNIKSELKPSFLEENVPDRHVFPFASSLGWNTHQMGPLVVPARGDTILLTSKNLPFYERVVRVYEHNRIEKKEGQVWINGQPGGKYVFKMNYYWVMGDNRPHSFDSRFWGFLPENHIIGKIPGFLTQ